MYVYMYSVAMNHMILLFLEYIGTWEQTYSLAYFGPFNLEAHCAAIGPTILC